MKKILFLLIAVLITSVCGCSKNTVDKVQPTGEQTVNQQSPVEQPSKEAQQSIKETQQPVATTSTSKVSSKTDYTVLEEFKVFAQDKGYGALILISEDASKEDIISLVKKIGENKDPVAIEIYTNKQAYEDNKTFKRSEEFRRGYVASYVKNKTLANNEYYGQSMLTWTQEVGKFSNLLFTTTNVESE